jgi:hypothetical protein
LINKLTEDQWQERATANAIAAARKITTDGLVRPGTPVGRLSDVEFGWIVAAILFGWISTRAEQAATEELDSEQTIRLSGLDPNPWDAGAVMAILPDLASADIDWSKPLADWPRESMAGFLLTAFGLIRNALIARDLGGGITRKSNAAQTARQANAAAGGPLLAPGELDDPIPF